MDIRTIKNEVKKLPISSILEAFEPSTLKGKCCFHEDKNAGSFKYKDDSIKGGIFTCFCCGATGDKVDFVMKHDNVDFIEANLRIAARLGIIDEAEYKKKSKHPETQPLVKVQIKEVKKVQEAERKDEEYLNNHYLAMKNVLELSDEHKEYLLKRGITEDELDRFFSINGPVDNFFWTIMRYIEEMEPQDFIGVPGFYYNGRTTTSKDVKGIAIPLINSKGLITSIQIRKDKVEGKEARYIFFSSSDTNLGCSCGAQVHVENPDKGDSVIITEGYFKAIELSKYFNSTVISVQGVNNTKILDTEIPELLKRRPIRRFVIAFDADMIENPNVKKAAKKLQKQLEKFNIPTGFMVWDEKYGKGADDVILAGNAEEFKFKHYLD